MTCKIDHHPKRDQIDEQIVQGIPFRSICASFDVTLGTLSRHKDCIREILRERMQGEREERGSAMLDRVLRLADQAEEILKLAKSKEDFRACNGSLVAAGRLLELCGRLSGELHAPNAGLHLSLHKTTINVGNFDDDQEFKTMVGEAAARFSVEELLRLRAIALGEESPLVRTLQKDAAS